MPKSYILLLYLFILIEGFGLCPPPHIIFFICSKCQVGVPSNPPPLEWYSHKKKIQNFDKEDKATLWVKNDDCSGLTSEECAIKEYNDHYNDHYLLFRGDLDNGHPRSP